MRGAKRTATHGTHRERISRTRETDRRRHHPPSAAQAGHIYPPPRVPPPQSCPPLREFSIGERAPAERRPMDLIPDVEPRGRVREEHPRRRAASRFPEPSIRDFPSAGPAPLQTPRKPAPRTSLLGCPRPSIQRCRTFGIERPPSCCACLTRCQRRLPSSEGARFPFCLPRYRLGFTHELKETLVTGTTVVT